MYHPAWDQVPGSTNVGYSHAEKDPNPTSAENFLIIGHFSTPSVSFLRGTPILPVLRAETLLGGGCHPRTTCMTIKDGPTHTRRLGSKTPRRSFAGALDPMHFFFHPETLFLFLDLREGASRPRCCLLKTRYRPAKDSNLHYTMLYFSSLLLTLELFHVLFVQRSR